ncbi:MAG: class I tRNA ligase family protein, partial [bacterium]
GNLSDFDPAKDAIPFESLAATDKYILSRFSSLLEECTAAYDNYQFYRVYQALQRFVVLDLSNFYLDVVKDRLYVSEPTSKDRRACQTVLNHLLTGILPVIAPITPHMAEDAWQNLPYDAPTISVFMNGWRSAEAASSSSNEWLLSKETDKVWKSILAIRDEVNQLLEKARVEKSLGSSLESKIYVHVEDPALQSALESLQATDNGQDQLRYILISSSVELVHDPATASAAAYSSARDGFTVGVDRAAGVKCSRCWNYSERVGEDADHKELCERCAPVISRSGFRVPSPTVVA